MNEFKVRCPFKKGDMIRGKKGNGYSYTNEHMIRGVVVGLEADRMEVKVLEGPQKYTIFDVENSLSKFDFYSKEKIAPNPISTTSPSTRITTDNVKNVTVSCGAYSAQANCDLSCDKFSYEYGLGLALERLGKEIKGQAGKTEKKYVKLCNLMFIDIGTGLQNGDIVEVVKDLGTGFLKNPSIFVKCENSTYVGCGTIKEKSKKYPHPVQYLSGNQYEPVKSWIKSDKPTKYVRVLNTTTFQQEVDVNDGDIVEILDDEGSDLYVRAPKKNIRFVKNSNIKTDYFTFLGYANKWEYVTPIF